MQPESMLFYVGTRFRPPGPAKFGPATPPVLETAELDILDRLPSLVLRGIWSTPSTGAVYPDWIMAVPLLAESGGPRLGLDRASWYPDSFT